MPKIKNLALTVMLSLSVSLSITTNTNAAILGFSTFIGGSDADFGYAIDVNSIGEAFITGKTESTNFPTTTGSYDQIINGNHDVFITKLVSSGSSLSYSTFIGGSSNEEGYGISVNGGNAYVTGYTLSNNFPTQNAYSPSHNGGTWDIFITKLSSNGNVLNFSTFFGGSNGEYGYGISVENGDFYLTGLTTSSDFPTQNSYDSSYNGGYDAFVTKFSSNGDTLKLSTFLGGTSDDRGYGIAVENGHVFLTGWTSSTDFPTQNAFDSSQNGVQQDAFVTKFSTNGNALEFSTFLGGSNSDTGYQIFVENGNAYVTGYTFSSNFPTQNAFDSSFNGNHDAFVTKFSTSGTSLEFSTFLGGSDDEIGNGIFVENGNIFLTGWTRSSDFPIQNPISSSYNGGNDLFITQFNSSNLEFSSFFGGIGNEHQGSNSSNQAVYKNGKLHFIASTSSTDFPMTNGVFDETYNGGTYDAAIVRFDFQTEQDSIAPSQITDFNLTEHNGTNLELKWTATGDDTTTGSATTYEIRQSINEITDANFSSATLVSNIPTPSVAGTLDSVTVSGLTLGVQYYFGIKAIDNLGNESPLSTQTSFGRAEITSITDVLNDNGKSVRINFNANLNDYTSGTGLNTDVYAIYRSENPIVVAPSGKTNNQTSETLPPNFDEVGTVTAFGDLAYTVVVPTLADSNATGMHKFEFLVRARALGTPSINSVSEIVMGYSVDEQAPAIPPNQNFVNNGNGTTTATWSTVSDSDLVAYTIWAEDSQGDFSLVTQVSPATTSTQNETFNNVSGAVSYTVGSVDENGNESLPFANRITSVEIEVVGNDVVLSWLGEIDASLYKIYRGTTPEFSNSSQVGTFTPNGSSPNFTDSGASQNADKYFYFVTWEN